MNGLIGKHIRGKSDFGYDVVSGEIFHVYPHTRWSLRSLFFGTTTTIRVIVKTPYGSVHQISLTHAMEMSDNPFKP